jgi:acyl-ACP thioesterase
MGIEGCDVPANAWKELFRVRSYEVDLRGRATLPVILNMMQEGASNDADSLRFGFSDLKEIDKLWVLSRIKILISAFPRWGDRITLYTWPGGMERLFALREFRILDEREQKIIRASSAWLVLDLEKRRPVRFDEFFRERGIPLDKDPSCEEIDKLPSAVGGKEGREFSVQICDLDINDHANGAKYLEWVLDSYQKQYICENEVCECTINFLDECNQSDTLVVRTLEHGNDIFLHSVVRVKDDVDVCRVLLKWRQVT